MPVRTAIIPAAGLGTRFLPASKAMPKELVTVVDRPIIQYAVEELVRAGITKVFLVISEGKESLPDHFARNARLETALSNAGKLDLLGQIERLHTMAEITSVIQGKPLGLGHAVWTAREQVGDEPFVVLLPDEMLDPCANFLGDMVREYEQLQSSTIAVAQVPHESIQSYGAIEPEGATGDTVRVKSMVEKPHPDEAPSDLAIIGRYVLDPEVMEILESVQPGAGGEIQLTDALAVLAGQDKLYAKIHRGRRWDAGTKHGYLEATAALAMEHPELGEGFRGYLETLRQGPEPRLFPSTE